MQFILSLHVNVAGTILFHAVSAEPTALKALEGTSTHVAGVYMPKLIVRGNANGSLTDGATATDEKRSAHRGAGRDGCLRV